MKNDADHVIDAGGSTANEKQSVFFMARGRGKCEWLLGNSRTLTFDPWQRQTVTRNNKSLDAMISWMHFNPGARLGNRNALLRIKNLTTQASHTLTYDHLTSAWQKFHDELGLIPDAIFMTGRSQAQLRDADKTDLNPNPPLPTSFMGVPFHITSNLDTGEAI